MSCTYKLLAKCLDEKDLPIIGIDPGENCGLIVRLRDVILFSWEGPKDLLIDTIERVLNEIEVSRIMVGNGNIDTSTQLIIALMEIASKKSIPLYLVDEPRTSVGTSKFRKAMLSKKLGRHAYSAFLISRKVSAFRLL
ncbi:hypothetical protein EYM_07770 [Ignicoccus islandicus DSM 13165]|uniref:Uncharacterized protein n=1 Tax=Ignicoccus islandicus DSM 13165 TaxID=940295 RepID=A0A0U3FTK6_9CREN|nr:hypothetical protein [Ignicoccus islandicus]ALU12816.1 hypothetical protein EYM_07770 [Ignicoccus islandicus DSM 13165]